MTVSTTNNYPLQRLYFYLTRGCNLACRHCWIAPPLESGSKHYPYLPVATFAGILKEAKPLGLHDVKLTGGEPLLHPEITKILEIIRQEELGLTVETNGVLCTPEIANEIAKSKKRHVSVSMDGADAETHEAIRGVKGSFEGARQGIRNLVAVGTHPQIIFSVMRSNCHQVEAIIKMAEELGANSVKFNVVQPTERGKKLHATDGTLSLEELITLGKHVNKDLAKTTKLPLYFDFPLAFRPLSGIAEGKQNGRCGIKGILGVIATGEYALCGIGENVPELVFGKAGQDSLEQVWLKHPKLTALRDGLPGKLEGICSECVMKSACLGSCMAQNYYASGSFWAAYWFCAAAEKAGMFPASRRARK